MQLNIPLMKPSVVTETLQVVTQETLGNSLQVAAEETIQDGTTLHPTLEEGLPQHIVDHIINELRADPELKRIDRDRRIRTVGNGFRHSGERPIPGRNRELDALVKTFVYL